MTRYLTAILALYLPLFSPAAAQETSPARLVKDMNRLPGAFDAGIEWIAPVNPGRAVFNLTTRASGSELWTSDGTLRGTRLLKEFISGSLGGNPQSPVSGSGKVMVQTTDTRHRPELWITDGTTQGTVLIATLPQGRQGYLTPLVATAAGGFYYRLRFTDGGPQDEWLWFTDGTVHGTQAVSPRAGGVVISSDSTSHLAPAAAGHTMFFTAAGRTVWRCDGTRESTRKIVATDAPAPGAWPFRLLATGGKLYMEMAHYRFQGLDYQVWSCTLEGGSLQRVLPGAEGAWTRIASLAAAGQGDAVYITAGNSLGMRQFLSTGGTTETTREIPLLHTDGTTWMPEEYSYSPQLQPILWRGTLYFPAAGTQGGYGLWATDGTPAGTRMVLQTSAPGQSNVWPMQLVGAGERIYFLLYVGTEAELWSTDGTATGTRRVSRSQDDSPRENALNCGAVECRGELCFISGRFGQASSLRRTAAGGSKTVRLSRQEKSSGSAYLADYYGEQAPPYDGLAGGLLSFVQKSREPGDTALLRLSPARGRAHGYGQPGWFGRLVGGGAKPLWTAPPYPVGMGFYSFDQASFRGKLGRLAIFTVGQADAGFEQVWVTDGSRRGTRLLREYREAVNDNMAGLHLSGFVTSGAHHYYTVTSLGAESDGLWRTDGTPEGTVKVPLPEGVEARWSAEQEKMADFRGELYFAAHSGSGGVGLWKIGAATGAPLLLKDGWTVEYDTLVNLTALGDRLAFGTYRPGTGEGGELWTTDGTAAGTRQVMVNPAGKSLIDIGPGFDLGGVHVLRGDGWTQESPRQWWRSDGTTAGTYPIQPDGIYYLPIGSESAEGLGAVAGGKLFYEGAEWLAGDERRELWVTDGTAQGTHKLEIFPGLPSSDPHQFLAVGKLVYFAADHPDYGVELWRSDGTAAGTVLAADIEPGPLGSFPQDLKVIDGKLYFHAQRPAIGRELFSIDLK